jgi:hypothetical protein
MINQFNFDDAVKAPQSGKNLNGKAGCAYLSGQTTK